MSSDDKLLAKTALLSNGDSVPLLAAAGQLVILNSLLLDNANRSVVLELRQACLENRPLSPAERELFSENGLAGEDGRVNPQFRSLVLASVVGQGDGIALQSPFTHPLDRALAELISAHATLQRVMEPNELADLLASLNKDIDKWSSQARNKPNRPFPPPSPN